MDDIIRRIEGLMRKAESTEFDAERETLLAKADELILKYQIDQAQLFVSQGRNETPIIRDLYTDNPWEIAKGILLSVIAQHNGCRTIQYGRYSGARLRKIVGFKSDVDMTVMLWESLVTQAMVMMARDYKTKPPVEHGKTWKSNYMIGFASGIQRRLAEVRDQSIKAMETEDRDLLPVLRDRKKLVGEFMNANFRLRSSQAISRKWSSAGHGAGSAASSRADIGVSGVGQRGKLGR